MKKIAALAALAMTGLALSAPAASATTSVAEQPDALGGLSSGFQVSPADIVLDTASELPVTDKPVKALKELGAAQVKQQLTEPGLHGHIG
ncbi:hypothetical protein ACWEQL_18965 [Kitasatospora sp. NPDC004240]